MEIDPKGKDVKLSASLAEVGSNKSSFEAEIEGEKFTMAFSGRFVGDILSAVNQEDLMFECTTAVAPGVFKIKDDDTFIHLVMPMRL